MQRHNLSCSGSHRHIAVIGAGPYGLALAAKLQAANADYVLLGRVMSFWRDHVLRGTCLLSNPDYCSLSYDGFDSTAYRRARGLQLASRLRADEFVAYGLWFQRNTCANLDQRVVVSLMLANGKYRIVVDDGDEITADAVVVAIGLKAFAFRPPEFATLPPEFVSHTSDLHDRNDLKGKKFVIIGSGQSALECAAFMTQENLGVEVVTRSKHVLWGYAAHTISSSVDTTRSLRATIRRALNNPDVYRQLPNIVRTRWLKHALQPAVHHDLKARLASVPFVFDRQVIATRVRHNRVELELDDHTVRCVDHVVLGTGYRVDVNAIPFLTPGLGHQIRRHDGYPELNSGMESTVPRLYFTGAVAAHSFGPKMWFVSGAPWAAERISRALLYNHNVKFQLNKSFISLPMESRDVGPDG